MARANPQSLALSRPRGKNLACNAFLRMMALKVIMFNLAQVSRLASRRALLSRWGCFLACLVVGVGARAQDDGPKPAQLSSNLARFESVDQASGIHYVRLLLSLPKAADAAQDQAPPRFSVECRDIKGAHDLEWFLSFGGVDSFQFVAPFHSTPQALYPPQYPQVKLRMVFEGYIKSKPFIRTWSALRDGEFRYSDPGAHSANMESARWFMGFLNSLPGLRIGYEKPEKGDPPELFFPTQPLLDEIKKTPICAP